MNYTDLDVNFEKRIQMMDEIGVDVGVLRIPCLEERMPLRTNQLYTGMYR